MNRSKDLRSAVHHWWPKAVQNAFWTDAEGYVHSLTFDGKLQKKKPKRGKKSRSQFGAIFKGHIVDDIGPWSHSFEPDFDEVDNFGPSLLKKIDRLLSNIPVSPFALQTRKNTGHYPSVRFENHDDKLLFVWAMSIAYRCPGYRRRMSLAGSHFGQAADANLGKSNVECQWQAFKELEWPILGSLDIFFRRTNEECFIFGDYVNENVTNRAPSFVEMLGRWRLVLDGHLMLPVTPHWMIDFRFHSDGPDSLRTFVLDERREFARNFNKFVASRSEQVFASEQDALSKFGNLAKQEGLSDS